jgi:uncharacterized membrane protein
MKTTRLEAFSDGVFAIVITIMVLELKVPHGADWEALHQLVPRFLAYILSFIYIGIYWNNHHHMLHVTDRVNGTILWANLHLLFWLSLTPVATAWMGENHTAALPTAVYGGVLLGAAIAYLVLQTSIIRHQGPHSKLAEAVKHDAKGKLSLLMYLSAILLAFVNETISDVIYAVVAAVWLVPDRRIESQFHHER